MRISTHGRARPTPPFRKRSAAARAELDTAPADRPAEQSAGSTKQPAPARGSLSEMDLFAHTTPLGVTWILLCEVLVLGWAGFATWTSAAPISKDWLMFGLLAASALIHMTLTKPAEERRRAAHLRREHIAHTSVWNFTGALILPVPLLLALVLIIRSSQYMIARKPLGRYLFTTSAITASVLATYTVADVTPVHDWFAGTRAVPTNINEVVTGLLAITAAAAAYYVAQTLIIGVARVFRENWAIVPILGSREENFDLAITISLGLVAAGASNQAFGLTLLVVSLILVTYTRLTQRVEQLETERNQLKVDALHDALTGLPNRRSFNPAAELALVTDAARKQPSALLMFDLDRFKQWNTDLGHIGADQVLTAVTRTLREHTRDGDLLCRWGGEEIAVLLPNTDASNALAVAERFRVAIESMTVTVTKPMGGRPVTLNQDIPGCTISGGIAISTEHGTELLPLQEAADLALQQAKDGGRNQVCLATPEPSRSTH
ncbi:diguanylate cyclase (GGDEF)-like protein [Tamaricihabitans halophyticus]|uniref:Diguanylate cyclase (GGDEF)-like protein n=1 Tax=Tamaricihabitans halophyticus TaxID=1262583 RepID=A0A4R2R1D0_9PSEU|nr:GGDEF domain-containing protein [Tamaricihabitans halophyticus]TCP56490.1 diguanylate cyclase (GGDEF)-like protein [Tamaricihabitans halophyticus]